MSKKKQTEKVTSDALVLGNEIIESIFGKPVNDLELNDTTLFHTDSFTNKGSFLSITKSGKLSCLYDGKRTYPKFNGPITARTTINDRFGKLVTVNASLSFKDGMLNRSVLNYYYSSFGTSNKEGSCTFMRSFINSIQSFLYKLV